MVARGYSLIRKKGYKTIMKMEKISFGISTDAAFGSPQIVVERGKRDITVDIIKGIGIVLMVVGHARAPLSDFISLFHMAIFFIASGFLINCKYADSLSGMMQYVWKKIKGLWVPYFVYTCIFLVLNNFFLKINVYTNNPEFLTEKILEDRYTSLGQHFELIETVKQIIKAIFFRATTQMGGAFWFFMTLFSVLIAYMVCEYLLRKFPKTRLILLGGQTVISLAFLAIGYICQINSISLKGFDKTFSVYILIHIGRMLKQFGVMEKLKDIFHGNGNIVMLLLGFVVLLCGYHRGYISIGSNNIENPLFFIVMSFAGWLLLYGMAGILQKISVRLTNLLSYISIHSVPIISLHFLSFKVINVIAVMIYGFESYMVAAFPVLMRTGAWWILYTIAGVFIPLFCRNLLFFVFKHAKR